MSGPKHTAGPWDYVPGTQHHGPYVTTDYGSTVADCYVMSQPTAWSSEPSKPVPFMAEMAEANARLIAAAPDLLEAAQKAEDIIDDFVAGCPDDPKASAALQALRAAIAKAAGESQ